MRKLLTLALFASVAAVSGRAQASDVYITPTGGSLTGCTATPRYSAAQFNTSGSPVWGSGGTQIGPGTLVHMCGIFSTEMDPRANGSAGNVIEMRFETGAKLSAATISGTQFLYLSGLSYWKINGGVACGSPDGVVRSSTPCNGQITFTGIGSAFGSVNGKIGIDISSNAHDIEIENLEIGPLYVHTSLADSHPSNYDSAPMIHGNNTGVNIHIHDSYLHDDAWCVSIFTNAAVQNFELDHNFVERCSHGLAYGVQSSMTGGGINYHHNVTEGPANFDTNADMFHHDGIHLYCTSLPCTVTGGTFWNSTFEGDWGANNTSPFFIETHEGGSPSLISNMTMYNLTFINTNANGRTWNNGVNLLGHPASRSTTPRSFARRRAASVCRPAGKTPKCETLSCRIARICSAQATSRRRSPRSTPTPTANWSRAGTVRFT